ncbi:MAG: hypothetical protein H6568_07005 [Lewinellaceae bacterium]|nr:hypothetical protein [Lewinellaceae bacterium]
MPRILSFLPDDFREQDGIIQSPLNRDAYEDVPTVSGAYIFYAKSQYFVYPRGKSKVFYIGQSVNLYNRLRGHADAVIRMSDMDDNQLTADWHWSRYQYALAFPCKIIWYKNKGGETPSSLEWKLIDYFYRKHFSMPVANGAFNYKG